MCKGLPSDEQDRKAPVEGSRLVSLVDFFGLAMIGDCGELEMYGMPLYIASDMLRSVYRQTISLELNSQKIIMARSSINYKGTLLR